jgi:hypothetical protein
MDDSGVDYEWDFEDSPPREEEDEEQPTAPWEEDEDEDGDGDDVDDDDDDDDEEQQNPHSRGFDGYGEDESPREEEDWELPPLKRQRLVVFAPGPLDTLDG